MKTMVRAGAGCALLLGSALGLGAEQVPGILPSGFGDAVDRDVKTVRDATAPFHSVAKARDAGYTQETDCVEKPPEGGMGYHFTKRQLRDATLEVARPEVLVYEKRADGSFKLNGVEYIVPVDAWKSSEPPSIMGQKMKRFDRAGIWYLHVWIWEHSPSGIFADWNPRVKCKQPAM